MLTLLLLLEPDTCESEATAKEHGRESVAGKKDESRHTQWSA